MPSKKQLYKKWECEFEFPETRHKDDPGYKEPKTPRFFTRTIKVMTLQEQIHADLKNAMLTNNTDVKAILRVLIGELNQKGKEHPDTTVVAQVKKLIESAKVIIASPDAGGDRIAAAVREISILEAYLPQQLSEEALRSSIRGVVSLNSYTVKDMGKVMSYLKDNFAGKYDGKLASALVKEILI